MNNMTTKEIWLQAPDGQLDDVIKKIIREKWDDEPTAIQILEAVDHCVYYGASSDFVVSALNLMLEQAMKREGLEWLEFIKDAKWREQHV